MWTQCLSGLPKINWGAVIRENNKYDGESYWYVVHYETHKVWKGRYCWDRTDNWDKTHPIKGFNNAVRVRRRLLSGDRELWTIREVRPYELEQDCIKKEDDKYEFKELKFPA